MAKITLFDVGIVDGSDDHSLIGKLILMTMMKMD